MDTLRLPNTSAPRIGVLGGMGPLATADFLAKLAYATPARRDQDHFAVSVDSTPQIPDRVAALEGRGEDPLPWLLASAQRLRAAGCGVIAMPCNTAHLWHQRLEEACALPVLHIADAVADELGPAAKVGLLGTSATLRFGLYQRRHDDRRQWLLPDGAEMNALVTPGIAAIKAGDLRSGATLLRSAARKLATRGAEALVLACTEIPLVISSRDVSIPVIDATFALARHTIAYATRMAARARSGVPLAA
jgi:aspartate racemase